MELASYLDHTLLNPKASYEMVQKLCSEAKQYQFASVCVHPFYVPYVSNILRNSSVAIGTTIGFPLGANTTKIKVFEAKDALSNGATELDMVMSLPAFFSKDYEVVESEISQIKEVLGDKILKVIIETALLDEDQIKIACALAAKAGADFVKTSTGFSTSGAKVEDVALMKESCGPSCLVKASGGVKDKPSALKFIEAGASRIGTSSATEILLATQ